MVFVALGTWQVQRLGWKEALIARVDARVHAAPVAPPAPARWPAINRAEHEYLRVALEGRFLHDKEALVQASTERGAGFWVLTPLQMADGTFVFVNRGFVPPERRTPSSRRSPPTEYTVHLTGLLRITEPGGGFLRHNDPAGDRWYSRDVAALAAARGLPLDRVAPYFVDAQAGSNAAAEWPVPGLTVIRFPNNHLVYAITWYALALMAAVAFARVWRADQRVGPARNPVGGDLEAAPPLHDHRV